MHLIELILKIHFQSQACLVKILSDAAAQHYLLTEIVYLTLFYLQKISELIQNLLL